MPTDRLPTDHIPGKPYRLTGALLNKQNEAVNAQNAGHVIQRGASSINAAGIATSNPSPPFVFGLATITGRGNDCPQDANEVSGKGFPCRDKDHYTCEFRYYDADSGNYLKYGETLELDAAGYYEATDSEAGRSSGPGFGPIPGYLVGDTTPAYLDVQRNKLIPVESPPSDPSHAIFLNADTTTIAQSTSNLTGSSSAPGVDIPVIEFYIEQFRAGVDNDFRVIGTISFPLGFYPSGTSYASSSTFNTAPCPHGTLFRIRSVIGRETDYKIKAWWQRLRFTGLGRRTPLCVANSVTEPNIRGGVFTYGWTPDESTTHRFKDAPSFNQIPGGGSQPGLVQVMYADSKDEWMVGVELHACIEVTNDTESDAVACCECKKFQTVYGHMTSISVAVGDVLEQGDSLGFVGDLGSPNYPHLHYEARFGTNANGFSLVAPGNGQSFNIDDVQVFPKVGARAAGTAPGAAQGTPAQIAHAKSTMTAHPIPDGFCGWYEQLGSKEHTGGLYYAKDLFCQQRSAAGATVTNFVDALTVVKAIDVQLGAVLLEHFCDDCVIFKNTESQESVPAYGVMRVKTAKIAGKRTVFEIGKPNDEFQRIYLVNGDEEVKPGEYGCGKWLDEAGIVKYAQFSPEVGQSWGAKKDSWALVLNRPGFTVVGEINTKEVLTLSAIQYQVNTNMAKSDSDMTKAVKGNVKLWMRNSDTGNWEVTEYIVEANPLGGDLTGGLYIALEWDSGEWLAACYED